MASAKRPSPCCNVKSVVRRISMAERAIVLRCTRCGQLRIKQMGSDEPAARPTHLRLIVSR